MKQVDDGRHRRVVIVGPGAIGTTLAVHLALGGCAVTLLDYRPERAARVQREGLRLLCGESLLRTAVSATTAAEDVGQADLAMVCVKCPALTSAGRALARLPGRTVIATLQNGLGVVEALTGGLGDAAARHTLLAAVTYQAASPDLNGTIRHVANLPTLFDGAAALRESARMAVGIFESACLPARVEDDLPVAVWRKLIVNAAINPLTALSRVRNGELAERADLREQMLALACEAAAVARAEGPAVSDEEARTSALEAARATAGNVSSMRQDVESGRPTEIEFLGGALLRLARKHGLPLPRTEAVTAAVRRLDRPHATA